VNPGAAFVGRVGRRFDFQDDVAEATGGMNPKAPRQSPHNRFNWTCGRRLQFASIRINSKKWRHAQPII
jgi:hypothetical protein